MYGNRAAPRRRAGRDVAAEQRQEVRAVAPDVIGSKLEVARDEASAAVQRGAVQQQRRPGAPIRPKVQERPCQASVAEHRLPARLPGRFQRRGPVREQGQRQEALQQVGIQHRAQRWADEVASQGELQADPQAVRRRGAGRGGGVAASPRALVRHALARCGVGQQAQGTAAHPAQGEHLPGEAGGRIGKVAQHRRRPVRGRDAAAARRHQHHRDRPLARRAGRVQEAQEGRLHIGTGLEAGRQAPQAVVVRQDAAVAQRRNGRREGEGQEQHRHPRPPAQVQQQRAPAHQPSRGKQDSGGRVQRGGGPHRVGSEPCQAREARRDARRQHAPGGTTGAGHGLRCPLRGGPAGAEHLDQEGKARRTEDGRRRKEAPAAAARSHHLRDAGRRRAQHVGNDQQRRGARERRQRGREAPAARRPQPRQREAGPEPGIDREPGRAGAQAEPGRGGAVLPKRDQQVRRLRRRAQPQVQQHQDPRDDPAAPDRFERAEAPLVRGQGPAQQGHLLRTGLEPRCRAAALKGFGGLAARSAPPGFRSAPRAG